MPKTLLDILTEAGIEVTSLKALLTNIANGGTDLAPVAGDLLAKLEAANVDLAGLAVVLPKEAFDVLKLHFDPRFHPGGAA